VGDICRTGIPACPWYKKGEPWRLTAADDYKFQVSDAGKVAQAVEKSPALTGLA